MGLAYTYVWLGLQPKFFRLLCKAPRNFQLQKLHRGISLACSKVEGGWQLYTGFQQPEKPSMLPPQGMPLVKLQEILQFFKTKFQF